MEMQGWEKIYSAYGETQKECLTKVVNIADKFKKEGVKRVLDLGCGTGRHSILLSNLGFNVDAIDISETAVCILNEKLNTRGMKNIRTQTGSFTKLPYEDNAFDAIICVLVLDHGTQWQVNKGVQEIYRVLKDKREVLVDFISVNDNTCGKGVQIEEYTFVSSIEDEVGVPHHYSQRNELEEFFSGFSNVDINEKTYLYKNGLEKVVTYDVIARK